MKKLLFILILGILLSLNFASALDFSIDDYKTFEKGDLKYGKIRRIYLN